MSVDTGHERIDEERPPQRTVVRLTPGAKPGQAGESLSPCPSSEPADRSAPSERNESSPPKEDVQERTRGLSVLPTWLGRLRYYGLALLLVAAATLLRWVLWDVLNPTPFLVFYLAWVAAAAFGGLGPGLLATLASWLCIELLFDYGPGHIGFSDLMSLVRLLIFLGGGLAVSAVGEAMRRSRIRERRQTEELAAANAALGESGAGLAKAEAIARLGNWEVDTETGRVRGSQELYRLFNLEPDATLDAFIEKFHPEDRHRVVELIKAAVQEEKPYSLDYRIVPSPGVIRYVHAEGTVTRDNRGLPIIFFGTVQDITERKQAEETLRESEEKYRFLVETAKDVIWMVDLQGRWTFVSGNAEKVTGYRADELIGKAIWDFLAPECRALVQDKWRRRLRGEDLAPYEVMFVGKDGRLRPFEVVTASIIGTDGNIVGVQGVSRDITERKRAEAALRESEEKYRFLVENSKDVTWTIDLQGRWTFISSNVEKVAGYRVDEIIGKTLWDFLAPECHDLVRERLRRRARGEDLPPYEVLMVDKDGRRIPFELVATSIVDDHGNVVGVQGVSRDITERKRAEQELNESRNRYQALIETTADFIWEMDAEGRYTYCSPQMKDLWGYEPEDMIGKSPFDVMPPEDRKQAIESFVAGSKSPQPLTGFEASSYDSQGRLITVEVSGVPFFDADGRLLGYRGISRDVTERKRAQEALAESRRKYRGLVEKVNDWVWEVDADGIYTYSSPRARDLLGYAPEEIVGKTPFDFMPPAEAERVRKAFKPTWLARKPLEQLENTLVRKDGRLVIVETSGMPAFADDGTFLGYTGIDRDITERKRAEEALRASQASLALAQEIAHLGNWSWNIRTNEQEWSDESFRIFGFEPGECRPSRSLYLELLHPEDRERILACWRDALEKNAPFDTDYRIIRRDGSVRHVHSEGQIVRDDEGQPSRVFGINQDITERTQAEEARRASEEKYRRIVETATEAIVMVDAEARIVFVNDHWSEIVGYSREESEQMTVFDLVFPEDLALTKKRWESRKQGRKERYESRLRRKDGGTVWVLISMAPQFGPAGEFLGELIMAVDITRRKKAEEALRQEKIFADKLLNAPQDTVFLFEPATGKPIRWNQRLAEVSGYDDEEIAGMKAPDDFYDEEDLQKAREAIVEVSAEGQGVVELSLVTKRGMHIPFEYTVTVVEAEDGRMLFLSIGRDITERQRAQEALRASEEKYRFLVENSKDITWTIDLQGRWTFISSNVENVIGYRADEVIGKTVWDFLAPECHDLVKERLGRRRRGEDVPPYEVMVVGRDGRRTPFELHTAPIVDDRGNIVGVQGVSRDITERKKAEEALRQWNATLESRVAERTEELEQRAQQLQKLTLELTETEERERKRLAEILHDDLQQVLAAARFQVGLLGSRTANDVESQEIVGQTKDLLGDAIAKSRNLSHELSAPGLSQADLGEAFEWLAEQMQIKHGFAVQVEMPDRIEVASEPLRVLLYKAAQELLFNAVKHAGVQEAKLHLRRRRGCLRLSVSDKGRGFDPAEPSHNLGFGLLSIRERVEYLGGRMKIRSAIGKGSVFLITVPDTEGSR